jgi:hypothetical protein
VCIAVMSLHPAKIFGLLADQLVVDLVAEHPRDGPVTAANREDGV